MKKKCKEIMVLFILYSHTYPENPDNPLHKYMISSINKTFASEAEATAWPY